MLLIIVTQSYQEWQLSSLATELTRNDAALNVENTFGLDEQLCDDSAKCKYFN